LAKRGPTPGSDVKGAKRGNRISGRKAGTAADKRDQGFYILLPPTWQEARPGMTDALAIQRRRLRYRSWHRGTREADLILGRFADAHLAQFSAEQLDRYGALLEKSDPDIYDWLTGRAPIPEADDSDVFRLLKDFKFHSATP